MNSLFEATVRGSFQGGEVQLPTGDLAYIFSSYNQVGTVAELRTREPIADRDLIFVHEYNSGTGVGGGWFRYTAANTPALFPDDGVINFKTAGGACWQRILTAGTTLREVPMEWGGVVSNHTLDQTDLVKNVFSAALKMALNTADRKAQTRRVCVVPTPKLLTSKTIYFNVSFVKIAGESAEWAFSNSGTYDAHPTAFMPDGKTPLQMTLVAEGATEANNNSSACYRDRKDITELTLYFYNGNENSGVPGADLKDTPAIGLTYVSAANTISQAQFKLEDVSIIGFGRGFANGDYSWGGEFQNVKFSDCYYATWLVDGQDNGERFSFNFCIVQNCFHGIWNHNWQGHITVYGGSYVWNGGEYFHLGCARGATLRPNHVEYVTSTSPIITTDNVLSGNYQVYPMVLWEGGTLVIARNNTDVITDEIILIDPAPNSVVTLRNISANWTSIDLTPNMRLAPDHLPYGANVGRVLLDGLSMQTGTWGQLARSKMLLNGGLLAFQAGSASSNFGGTSALTFVKDADGGYVEFSTSGDGTDAKFLTFEIPLARKTDWWSAIPVLFLKDVVLANNQQWSVTWTLYNKTLTDTQGQMVLGSANIVNGSTEVFPLNEYNRPVELIANTLEGAGPYDTIRVTITAPGWSNGDGMKLIGGGVITT